jgi:putative RecB family exonuclease
VTLYSHSRISAFENCPRKYCFRYIEKLASDWESVEAFLGKRVHEILERLYHHLQRHGRPPSLAQMHARFRSDWQAHWHPRVRIVREENGVEHYLQYGEQCLSHYYRSHYPFDDGDTIAIEQELQISLDADGRYKLRGIVDRIARTRGGGYEVHDYKTSANLPPIRRLAGDRQLALYQIGLQQTYPDVGEVELIWHYLGFNKTLRLRHSAEQLDELRQETVERIHEIEAAREYPARPGPLCRWCEYAEVCPAVRRASTRDALGAAERLDAVPRGQLSLF